MTLRALLPWVICIGASFLAGAIGSSVTIDQIPTWYASLTKPTWTPPEWVFAPVWNVLYLCMGSAAALVWGTHKIGRVLALWLFFAHLAVNALWSVVFFGLEELWLALWVIFVLWVSVGLLTLIFARYSKWAAFLMVPYFLWVSYAMSLNLGFAILN